MKLPVQVYTAESISINPRKMLKTMFLDLKASRGLAYQWTKRDISGQYRQSILGVFWAFLLPLVNSLMWIFLQFTGVIKLEETGMPYPVYVFSGTILWQIFTESMAIPLQQVIASKSVLSKLNFPREAILLSGIYKILFNTLIKIVILIPVLFLFGVFPDWKIVLFPLAVLSIMLVGFSIGLLLTPIGTLYTDIGRMIPIAAQFLMFISPVVYLAPETGVGALIFKWNFTTPLLITARDFLTAGSLDWLNYFLIVNMIAVVILFFSWLVFRITMPVLIERMSA